MESILGKILTSAMMCAATGGDPEVESKKCAEDIMMGLSENKNDEMHLEDLAEIIANMPMCIRVESKAGSNRLETRITGHPIAITTGTIELLKAVGIQVASKQDKGATEIIKKICEDAIHDIDRRGL